MKKTDKVDKTTSTSQKVEAFIRKAIYQGRLKPRERIIEEDIARQLGCSRGPVREAVLRLERDGMIVITQRRGTFIRDIGPNDVEVVFSMRGKLEGLCVRYMREAMTAESKALVVKALHALKVAAAERDDETFLQADMRLHRTIWRLSGKLQLYRTLNFVMNPLFFMVARAYSAQLNPVEDAYLNHERYIETVLTAPIGRVEREVEKYFTGLFKQLNKTVFHGSAPALQRFQEEADEFGFKEDSPEMAGDL
jgi:DNA-binding GntR family transcriptional regulator